MQESYSKKAVRNTVYIFLNWFSQNVLGLVFWIILGKLLLPSELGTFSAILNFGIFVATFALLGIPQAALKFISEYTGKKAHKKVKAVNRYVFKIMLASSIGFSLFMFLFGNLLSKIINLSYSQLLLSIPVLIAICFLYLSGSVVYAIGRVKELTIGNVIYALVKLIAPVVLLFIGFGYVGLIAGVVISAFAGTLYRLKFIGFGKEVFDRKNFWVFASSSLLGALTGVIYNQGGVLITKALSTAAATGIFTLAFMLSMPLRSIPGSLAGAIFPLESEAWGKGKKETVRSLISRVLKYSYMLCIPIVLIFSIFSKEIILFIGRREYLLGIDAIRLLVIGLVITGIGSVYSGSLYFTGKPKITRNLSILLGMSVVLLGIPLTLRYNIIGISVAYLFSGIIFFISSVILSKKYIGVSFEKRYLFITFISAILAIPVLYIFRIYQPNVLGIVLASIIFSSAYLYLLLRLKFFDKKDIELLRIVGRKLPKGLRRRLKHVERIIENYVN